ncbi:DUF6292 family protein [Actinokineospora auranticolor]|uniref:DUF6292 domain-containing protein n=1 Tax=Actinokineospora auranticolor TaxID=155976 RepID=A0A2S6GIC2_9PSEU|nr:DUF6292 family protein [Actinokineospora auranticolor]PPK64969.1 hypothetical protein CLV40_11611 [Actinokineospora auranticolor]
MTSDALHRALGEYLGAVAEELGVGAESTTVDLDTPLSAYIALDTELPDHPGRDTALLWDERHGWSVAVETHSGEDLVTVAHLAANAVAPAPRRIARFLAAVARGDRRRPQTAPVAIRDVDDSESLLDQLRRHPMRRSDQKAA